MGTREVEHEEQSKEGVVQLEVKIQRELFGNSETSFYIYGANPVSDKDKEVVKMNNYGGISFKGNTPKLNVGEKYIVELTKDKKSTYAGSYNLETVKQKRPEVGAQQRDFLETILTPAQVNNIYDFYKMTDDILLMIENETFEYTEIKGLGGKTFEKLKEKVLSNLHMSEVLVFLAKYNIKFSSIKGLIKQFVNPLIVIDKIKENPYLLTEIKGVGFLKADAIAKSVGFKMESPFRINSAIRYIIREENNSGHSWILRKRLLSRAIELLDLKKDLIIDVLDNKHDLNIIESKGRFTTLEVYKAENIIAETLINLNKHNKLKIFESDEVLGKILDEYCEENGVELEEKQREFFFNFNNNPVSMLIGGGGMGKTWILKILLDLVDQYKAGMAKALLAPTGKASKVLQTNTGRNASTVHRKILRVGGEKTFIYENILVIDESSMCDVVLVADLLSCIHESDVKILFVGDDFQLPSVGVGNFLYDVIKSGRIVVTKLQKVFRTKDGGILEVSTNFRENRKFLNDFDEGVVRIGSNAIFHLVDSEFAIDGVKHYHERLLKSYNDDEILVLSPTKKNKFGVEEINKHLQEIVNPERRGLNEKSYGKDDKKVIFREQDMVMNVDNTYNIPTVNGGKANVYNGDVGRILDIDDGRKLFVIDYGDEIVIEMGFDKVKSSLVHANCMSVHKSQGSQSPVVVVVLDKSMRYQLNANLLYTAVSRAQKYLIVIGDAKTINASMDKFINMERRSFLQELLEAYDTMQTEDILDYRSIEKEYLASLYGNAPKKSVKEVSKEEDLELSETLEAPPKKESSESIDDFFDDMLKEKETESAIGRVVKKKEANKKEEDSPFMVSTPYEFNEVLPF